MNNRWINAEHRPNLFLKSVFDLLYHQTDAQLNWQKSTIVGVCRSPATFHGKSTMSASIGDIRITASVQCAQLGLGIQMGGEA